MGQALEGPNSILGVGFIQITMYVQIYEIFIIFFSATVPIRIRSLILCSALFLTTCAP